MSEPGDNSHLPADFSGIVRLFPVPNLVMFPHVIQPLHVFEPRYRELTEDALADDQLIALPVLCPGWEKQYEGRPPLRPIACLGKVVTHHRQEDGRYNLLLLGLCRVRLLRELAPTRAFRQAQAELVEDLYPTAEGDEDQRLTGRLLSHFSAALSAMPEVRQNLDHLLRDRVPLGTLTDIVGHTLRLPRPLREQLLSQPDVQLRARLLLEQLDAQPAAVGNPDERFPPDFSVN